MVVEVLYFAWVREAIGKGSESIELADDIDTVAALIDWLAQQGEGYAQALADKSRLRVALDKEFSGLEASLDGVREVALFPPVTGG